MLRRTVKIQLVIFVAITLAGVSYVGANYVGFFHGITGHACTVKAVRWSPCGRYLATAAYDKRIRIFERETWREVQSVRDTRMWNRTLAWSWPGRIATGSFGGAPVRWRIGCSPQSAITFRCSDLAAS